MREIKKYIKKPSKPLQQMFNRLAETDIINKNTVYTGFIGRPWDHDIFPGCNTSYRAFKFNSFILKNNLKDSCCMIAGIPIEVQGFGRIDNNNVLFAKKFLNQESFFTHPVDSMDFGIMLVDSPGPEDETFIYNVEDVDFKLVRLPYRHTNVA